MKDDIAFKDAAKANVVRARGISIPFNPKGRFNVQHIRKGKVIGEYTFPNGITDEGKANILNVMFHGTSATGTWYVGLIDNASFSALDATDVMNSHAGWIELTAYDEAARVAWTEGAASGAGTVTITNAVSLDFTISATKTVKGIFVTSVSTKGGTTGILWATGTFTTPPACEDDDVVKITYTVSC